jgi:hypothetical protein
VKGANPPDGTTVAEPVDCPLQATFVGVMAAVIEPPEVTITDPLAVQPLDEDTTTV